MLLSASNAETVAAGEVRSQEGTDSVEGRRGAEAATLRTDPPEEQGREEHGEPVRMELRRHVTESEDDAGRDEPRAHQRAEELPARCPHFVESRLNVPSIEGFFGQGDDEPLT